MGLLALVAAGLLLALYASGAPGHALAAAPSDSTSDTATTGGNPAVVQLAYDANLPDATSIYPDSVIRVVETDGRAILKLTGSKADLGGVAEPTWSPDGNSLAYTGLQGHGNSDIWTVNLGTGGRSRLTRTYEDSGPAWSPDSKSIAFQHFNGLGDGSIYLVHAVGGGRTRLTQGYNDLDPAWSPDATQIAFARDSSSSRKVQTFASIYILSIQSRQIRRLTRPHARSDGQPSWSPDGREIVFPRSAPDNSSALYAVHVDGTGLHPITPLVRGVSDVSPAWSPDGTKIAFARQTFKNDPSGSVEILIDYQIYSADGDGHSLQRITRDRSTDEDPVWRPTK